MPDEDGIVSLPVRVRVVAAVEAVALAIRQRIDSAGIATAPVRIDVHGIQQVVTAPIRIDVQPTGQAALPLAVNVHAATIYPNGSFVAVESRWAAAVEIAGVAFGARCVGSLSVEIERGASRMADFAVHIIPADFDERTWVGQRVSIDYKVFTGSGAAFNLYRIFTGLVETLSYHPDTQIMSVRCSDGLQRAVNAAPKSAIDDTLGDGAYSPMISNPAARPWQYAQDRLSALPGSLDLNRYGGLRYTPWFGAGSSGVYDESNIIADSFVIEQERPRSGDEDSRATTITIDYSYRFPRVKSRMCRFFWRYPFRVGEQIENGYSELTRQMVRDAVNSVNWGELVQPISFDPIPPSGLVTFIGPDGYTTVYRSAPPEIADLLCWGFRASLAKRFAQTITEQYKFVVKLNGGAADHEEGQTRSMSFDVSFDTNTWEKYPKAAPLITPPIAPGEKFIDVHAPDANLIGGEVSRELHDGVVQTIVNQARRTLAEDAQLDTANFNIILQPYMDSDRRVTVNCRGITRTGMVRQVVHTLDFASGKAHSKIGIALTKAFAVGGSGSDDQVPDFNVVVPPHPTPPTITAAELLALTVNVGTEVAPVNEDSLGANVAVMGRDSQPPQRLRLTGPDVAGPSHDPWTSPVTTATYSLFM